MDLLINKEMGKITIDKLGEMINKGFKEAQSDLHSVKVELKQDISDLRYDLKADVHDLTLRVNHILMLL